MPIPKTKHILVYARADERTDYIRERFGGLFDCAMASVNTNFAGARFDTIVILPIEEGPEDYMKDVFSKLCIWYTKLAVGGRFIFVDPADQFWWDKRTVKAGGA